MATLPPMTELAGTSGALFEGYWGMLEGPQKGHIDAVTAANFLKKSQLREPVLHKIWDCSDPNGRGYLDKQGFFMALRLVAAAQAGKEVAASSLALSDPPPKLVGVELPTSTAGGVVSWTIEAEERTKFDQIFQSSFPGSTLLSGDKAKPMMLASKLPVDALSKIWNLADIDQDGNLDKDEFAVALKLIQLAQAGETLPLTLPSSIIPASKNPTSSSSSSSSSSSAVPVPGVLKASVSGGLLSSLAVAPPGSILTPSTTAASGSPALNVKGGVASSSSTSTGGGGPASDWVVAPDVKAKYDSYFHGIDKDHDGLVTGEEARGLFMASNLQQGVLAHIWKLCDIENVGKLNAEQFALAMFLIAEKVRGKEAPTELATNMIPPSLRKQTQAPPTSTTLSSDLLSSSWTTPTTTATIATTAWTTPLSAGSSETPGLKEPADAASSSKPVNGASGFDTDFSAIMELDNISNEIEGIRKEKTHLQDEIRQKQELILQRKGEIETLQGEVSVATRQKAELELQKNESQKQLEELDSEKAKFEGQIAELTQNCRGEQQEIDRLKRTLSEQESSSRSQAEEMEQLKKELERLRFEEKEYRQKVESNNAELEKLQKSNQHIQSDITQVRSKIESLKEEHHTLSNQLMMYTPGSAPSSSVININDVGHLPTELHVPHISEPDAISARATAGSSSPVSSISGFSTNSHLEDAGDDGSSSRGDSDKTQTIKADPFGSTSSSSAAVDPFAAFSLPPGSESLFSGGSLFSGKASDVSAFDPFGPSDPFKSSSSGIAPSTSGEDFFKSDPFGSVAPPPTTSPTPLVSGTSGSTATAGGGGTTDPFSGQDPFSSDPFASSKTDNQSPWGGGGSSPFAVDPFSNQGSAETPTDPFASGYSFGDDTFGSNKAVSSSTSGTGGGAGGNPFSSSSSSSATAATTGGGLGTTSSPSGSSAATGASGLSERDSVSWAKKESKKEEALRKRQLQKEEEDLARALKESLNTS